MKRWCILGVVLLAACRQVDTPVEPRLVVEGWIENGGAPVVKVSESIGVQVGQEFSMSDLAACLAQDAVVTVSDGEKTVTLEGKLDFTVFPPYRYTTDEMLGEVGRTYTLRVEYKDYVATAETTIPAPVPIEKLYVREINEGKGVVVCGFTDPAGAGNCYKVFVKTIGKDSEYSSAVFALVSDENLHGYTELSVFSTLRLQDMWAQPNLEEYDRLYVKLCTMTPESFRFWDAFERKVMGNAMKLRATDSVDDSTLQGAQGYWIGYGVDAVREIKVIAPSSGAE